VPNNALIDLGVVQQVVAFGYPESFVVSSVEGMEKNDACTLYYLLES
jgi:hypothetical protein